MGWERGEGGGRGGRGVGEGGGGWERKGTSFESGR